VRYIADGFTEVVCCFAAGMDGPAGGQMKLRKRRDTENARSDFRSRQSPNFLRSQVHPRAARVAKKPIPDLEL
jgi:hypothetical protein